MPSRLLLSVLSTFVFLSLVVVACLQGGLLAGDGHVAAPCPAATERVLCMPRQVTELRRVRVVVCRPELRERTVTVCERVPITETVMQTTTVCVPETRTCTVQQLVCKPIYKKTSGAYSLPVFRTEMKTGTRTTVKMEPVTVLRTVCEDLGHWEVRACEPLCKKRCGHCGAACGEPCCCKVWVANLVRSEVPFVELQPRETVESYEYPMVVEDSEQRSWERYQVCGYEKEWQPRVVSQTVWVRKCEVRPVEVTRYQYQMVQKTIPYTVMVPQVIEKDVPVTVCRTGACVVRVPCCRGH